MKNDLVSYSDCLTAQINENHNIQWPYFSNSFFPLATWSQVVHFTHNFETIAPYLRMCVSKINFCEGYFKDSLQDKAQYFHHFNLKLRLPFTKHPRSRYVYLCVLIIRRWTWGQWPVRAKAYLNCVQITHLLITFPNTCYLHLTRCI